jgi:dTDP-glucose 4,6-dehydratase
MAFEETTRRLGWTPRRDMEAGLKETVDWYLDNRAWWRAVKAGEYLDYYERVYEGRSAGGG